MRESLPQQKSYSDAWARNAEGFELQGCYSWMAGLLIPYRPGKILDVGCGTGHGLQAIIAQINSRIISVEENIHCMQRAKQLLESSDSTTELIKRLQYQDHADGGYTAAASTQIVAASARISLVQGDLMMEDASLLEFIADQAPFDAVTMWLIGTEPTRCQKCRNIQALRIGSPEKYRLLLQKRIYQLAGELLADGGVVQLVDRAQVAPEIVPEYDFKEMHQEMANLGKLRVQTVNALKYTEPETAGVGMVSPLNPGVRIANSNDCSMISVISIKD